MSVRKTIIKSFLLACFAVVTLPAASALATEPPVKQIVSAHIGFETDALTKGNVCAVSSGDPCQPGKQSSSAGGFSYAHGIAGAPNGNVYVADSVNHRVQEFTSTGQFVLMWGKKVNKNGTSICTNTEESQCQTGEESGEPGVFGNPRAIAVDPVTEDVYVADTFKATRVQKFTANGKLIHEIGVTFGIIYDVTVGGSEDRLYVGERNGLQEFTSEGVPVSEPAKTISARLVEKNETEEMALAVDSAGDIYTSSFHNVVRRFDPSGKETELTVAPRVTNEHIAVAKLALDPAGRLALVEREKEADRLGHLQGTLYEPSGSSLRPITAFSVTASVESVAFNGNNDMYLLISGALIKESEHAFEVLAYEPIAVGEPVTGAASCHEGVEQETNVTILCALEGQINPYGVPNTETWFTWGKDPRLGSETPIQTVCSASCPSMPRDVSPAVIEGLLPNATYYYQLDGYDANVKAPEVLVGPTASVHTESVPPKPVGEPSVTFVHATTAIMSGEVNPENTPTVYAFQYGACPGGLDGCANTSLTEPHFSNEYAPMGVAFEATGLQPSTVYHYRLVAVNEDEQVGTGPEATFATTAAPAPSAQTNGASAVSSTSAVVSGTVNPDGAQAVYRFELGIYKAAETRYGIVVSAPAGEGSVPVGETLALSGLQPGTTYAYRIAVKSGYGEMTGQTLTFTTEGLPAVISLPTALGLLEIPHIAFPKTVSVTVRHETRKRKPKRHKRAKRHGGKTHGRNAHKRKK